MEKPALANPYMEKLRHHVLDFMDGETVKIYLFGSWARDEQRRSSDVDLAIDYIGQHKPGKLAALRDSLEESTIPYRVDVVDMHSASEGLLREIRKDGILWKG